MIWTSWRRTVLESRTQVNRGSLDLCWKQSAVEVWILMTRRKGVLESGRGHMLLESIST